MHNFVRTRRVSSHKVSIIPVSASSNSARVPLISIGKLTFEPKMFMAFQSEILYTLMLTSLLSPHPRRLLGLFENNKMSWRNPAEDLVADRDAVQTEMWQKRPKIQEMWSISPLHQVGPLSPLSCQSWWKLSYSFRSELFCDGNVNCAVGTQLPAGLSHQLSL